MKLLKREQYLEVIRPFYDSDIIKVITGIRRAGKSCLMRMIQEELIERGVSPEDIYELDLDKWGNKWIRTPEALEKKFETMFDLQKGLSKKLKYLFIDEIQNVRDYEPIVNALNNEGNLSIFLTGSNSYLLSGELVTKLTGRYLEFEIFPLDFKEYLKMKQFKGLPINPIIQTEFQEYIRNGGFPKSLDYPDLPSRAIYTKGIIAEIFKKDIQTNRKIKHPSVFARVQQYVIKNYGSTFSVKSIHDYFTKTEGLKITRETIARYVQILVEAKIIYECKRFDCKSRQTLSGEQKFYLADLSIYFADETDNRINYGPALENLVFHHLRTKGYSVSVGRIGKTECDFIARKDNDYSYYQIAMSIADRATEDREYKSLLSIRDNYPKYLLTMDPLLQKRDGVIHLNIIDFLTSGA